MSRTRVAEEMDSEQLEEQAVDVRGSSEDVQEDVPVATGDDESLEPEAEMQELEEVPQEERMGVVRFLQLHPHPKMVSDLMKSLYKTGTHTEQEWLGMVDNLVNKKIGGK